MKFDEYILQKLSRKQGSNDYDAGINRSKNGDALNLLRKEYPNLSELVSHKKIVDFGCGEGKQSLALSEEEGCFVCGVDTNDSTLTRAINNARDNAIDENKVLFCTSVPDSLIGTFDLVVSQNAMEHFPDPKKTLLEMKRLISDNGKLLITFGPPWFAPYGSHMHFFCKVPYINIIFSEKTVMNVRLRYRSDGAMRYVDVESGLNMMTLRKFENTVDICGLKFDTLKYRCVKGQDWLSKLPIVRELFVNHVTCVLVNKKINSD